MYQIAVNIVGYDRICIVGKSSINGGHQTWLGGWETDRTNSAAFGPRLFMDGFWGYTTQIYPIYPLVN